MGLEGLVAPGEPSGRYRHGRSGWLVIMARAGRGRSMFVPDLLNCERSGFDLNGIVA